MGHHDSCIAGRCFRGQGRTVGSGEVDRKYGPAANPRNKLGEFIQTKFRHRIAIEVGQLGASLLDRTHGFSPLEPIRWRASRVTIGSALEGRQPCNYLRPDRSVSEIAQLKIPPGNVESKQRLWGTASNDLGRVDVDGNFLRINSRTFIAPGCQWQT
jgi:hypothetical protein